MLYMRRKCKSLDIMFKGEKKNTQKSQHSWKYNMFLFLFYCKVRLETPCWPAGTQAPEFRSTPWYRSLPSSHPVVHYCRFSWCIVIRWKWVIMKISFDFYIIKYKLNTLPFWTSDISHIYFTIYCVIQYSACSLIQFSRNTKKCHALPKLLNYYMT